MFVKLSLLLTAFLVVRISVRKFNSSPPALCAPTPSPHCLINFCRWQKLTQICVYQEIINISSQVFLSLATVLLSLLFVWLSQHWQVWRRGYFVRLRPAAGQPSGHWTPLRARSVSQESGYIQHQGSAPVRGQFKVHIICSGLRRMLFCGDKNACKFYSLHS